MTVDFIPLICAVIGLCFGVFSFLSATLDMPSAQVAATLESVMDEPGFAPAAVGDPEPADAAPVQPSLPTIEPEQESTQSGEPAGDAPQPLPVASGSGGTGTPSGGGVSPVVAIGVMPGSGGGAQGGAGAAGGPIGGDAAVFGSDAPGSDPDTTPDTSDAVSGALTGAGADGDAAVASGTEGQERKRDAFDAAPAAG